MVAEINNDVAQKKTFNVQINKCNVHRKQSVVYKTNKKFDECVLTKRITSEFEKSTTALKILQLHRKRCMYTIRLKHQHLHQLT